MLYNLKLENINPEIINLTGVRLIVVFALLLDSPKSVEEINEYFEKNNYPNNSFSSDTLRNDLNALRKAGCEISRADKSTNYKYILNKNPMELDIKLSTAKSIKEAYLRVYPYLDILSLISLENLLNKLSTFTKNEEVAEFLIGISIIKNTNKTLLKDLIKASDKNQYITFKYKAPTSGLQTIELLAEKIDFRSKKLYLFGYSLTHNSSALFLLSKIVEPIIFNIQPKKIDIPITVVKYELKNSAFLNYKQKEDEKIIEKTENKIIIEVESANKFILTQKILAYANDCTILEPQVFKDEFIEKLKKMQRIYEND